MRDFCWFPNPALGLCEIADRRSPSFFHTTLLSTHALPHPKKRYFDSASTRDLLAWLAIRRRPFCFLLCVFSAAEPLCHHPRICAAFLFFGARARPFGCQRSRCPSDFLFFFSQQQQPYSTLEEKPPSRERVLGSLLGLAWPTNCMDLLMSPVVRSSFHCCTSRHPSLHLPCSADVSPLRSLSLYNKSRERQSRGYWAIITPGTEHSQLRQVDTN